MDYKFTWQFENSGRIFKNMVDSDSVIFLKKKDTKFAVFIVYFQFEKLVFMKKSDIFWKCLNLQLWSYVTEKRAPRPPFFWHFPVPLMDFDALKSKLDFFGTLTNVPYALNTIVLCVYGLSLGVKEHSTASIILCCSHFVMDFFSLKT